MDARSGLAVAVIAAAIGLLADGVAIGQVQNKDQQKCINALNKDVAKVVAAQGKENAACVKQASKGSAAADCLTADTRTKVATAKTKTSADEISYGCAGGNAPDFGYTSAAFGNTSAQNEEVALFADVYGTTNPAAVISTNAGTGACQAAVTKDLEKAMAVKWKVYLACKKAALRNDGASAGVLSDCLLTDPSSVLADPKGKIAKSIDKLQADIADRCAMESVASTFPGKCSTAFFGSLFGCLDSLAMCRLCRTINAVDGVSADCDFLDDGDDLNDSCS